MATDALEINDQKTNAVADDKIALCLSGGGLRATLFHFGLIKALAAHSKNGQSALSHVREVYSVSGGSITAAHLITNWTAYNDPSQWDGLQNTMLAFAGRNIRDRVLRRWFVTRPLPASLDLLSKALPLRIVGADWAERRGLGTRRTDWLRREYEGLLGSMPIADCYRSLRRVDNAEGLHPPDIYILTTSFTSGNLCSFSRDTFEVEPNPGERRGAALAPDAAAPVEHEADGGQVPLAFAVAASSAFPPLFPPIKLSARMLRRPADDYFDNGLLLSDGGVFDNLGFEKFALVRARSATPVSTLFVSNAGGAFKTATSESFSGVISRNIRASDILMRRVGDTTAIAARALAKLRETEGLKLIDVQIRDSDADDIVMPATQKSLRLVRTDLDRFDGKLAALLIDHGYRVASKQLRREGWQVDRPPTKCIDRGADDELAAVTERAATRTMWRSLFFDLRDPIWLFAIWLGLALLVAGAVKIGLRAAETAAARRDEQQAIRNENKAIRDENKKKAAEAFRQQNYLAKADRELASGDVAAARQTLLRASNRTEQTATQAIATAAAAEAKLTATPAAAKVPPMANLSTSLPKPGMPAAEASGREEHNQQVYIQFAGALTRQQIKALNQALKNGGWNAQGPSGERTPLARGKHEVRYSGNNLAAAQDLAATVNKTGITPQTITPNVNTSIGSNVLEIWIGLD